MAHTSRPFAKLPASLCKLFLATGIAGFCGAGAFAKTYCIFPTECFEADACQDAAFRFDFTKGGSAGSVAVNNGVRATTEFGDLGGYILTQTPDSAVYIFEGSGARYFLTTEGRDARMSVHMQGPMVVTYVGTCEDLG